MQAFYKIEIRSSLEKKLSNLFDRIILGCKFNAFKYNDDRL